MLARGGLVATTLLVETAACLFRTRLRAVSFLDPA